MNIRRSAVAFLAIALIASAVLALDLPPKPTQWVNDYGANLLSTSETQQLNEKLEGLYKRSSVQFLIMIFPSLEGEDELAYTKRVASQWKVKDDRALILFVFMKERRTRIQVGYGLEHVITDPFAYDILNTTIPPYFRAGKYAEGFNAAIDRMTAKIDPNGVPAGVEPSSLQNVRSSPGGSGLRFVAAIILFGLMIGIALAASARRRRAEAAQNTAEKQRDEESARERAEAAARDQAERERRRRASSSRATETPRSHPNLPSDVIAAYETLELLVGASFSEVEQAYRNLAQLYHPDKVHHLAPEFRALAAVKMRNINAARDRLRRYRAAQA